MTKPEPDRANPTLREWLRNDYRLGIRHVGVRPAPASRPAASGPSPAARAGAGALPARESAGVPHAAKGSAGVAPARRAAAPTLPIADAPDLPPLCRDELAPAAAQAALEQLDAGHVRGCQRCRLHAQRTQTVFGVGNPRPELVFVGEGPGADEDAQGLPFVGRAGQLLTRMIAAMGLTREQVYICNVVKCRPPGNRTPADDEMATCQPFLFRQLAILRPKIIVTLGRPATQTLLVSKVAISRLRGQFHDFPPPALAHWGLPPVKLMPTFHPAYLLRDPSQKAFAWEDLKQVMGALGLKLPPRAGG